MYSIILYKSEYWTETNANHMNVGYRSVTNAMSSLIIIRIFISNSRSFYISANESHTHSFEPVGIVMPCTGHCPSQRSLTSTHFYFWQFNFFRVTDTCQLKVEKNETSKIGLNFLCTRIHSNRISIILLSTISLLCKMDY